MHTRQPSTRTTRSTFPTKSKPIPQPTPDDLAEKLATKLKITDSKGKSKAKELTLLERKANAMRAVNSASKGLSTISESGWKATQATPSDRGSSVSVKQHATSTLRNLSILRDLNPGDVDVERAASSVVGKLVGLEMYDLALSVLQDMRTPLIGLYNSSPLPPPPVSPPHHLLILPLPQDPILDLHLSLISTYILHTLHVLAHVTPDLACFLSTLYDSNDTLLAWAPTFIRLPEKQHDQLFTRAYTVMSRRASSGLSPSLAYSLRIYALICLAQTRASVVSADSFWEQAVKFTAMYTNTDTMDPQGGVRSVCKSFLRLVSCAEKREDCVHFMSGVGFARFCEYWSRFAKQTGDHTVLAHITRLSQTTITNAHTETDKAVIETSALSTMLATALAVFEHWSEHATDFTNKLGPVANTIHRSGPSLSQTGSDHDRVRRGLERLRRAASKVVECTDKTYPPEVATCARSVLGEIVDVLCQAIEQYKSCSSSILSTALESLFIFARTTFILNNPDTYTTSYLHLARANSVLSSVTVSTGLGISPTSLANYTRCVAAVYHQLAGQLHQSGRYDHAVRFLEAGCDLSQRALNAHRRTKEEKGVASELDEESAGREEAWIQLEEQLYRRWELLGVCHARTGDRKLAYDAFLSSIRSFPFARHSFVELSRTTSLSRLFEDLPVLKQLSTLLDRGTYIAACELFHAPASVPALSWFPSDGEEMDQATKCIVGALLERQITSLQESKWKQGVAEILRVLIDDALLVYDPEERPIRHARVILKQLELGLCAEEELTRWSKEGLTLLSRKGFALDESLARFCPELRASIHLWLAVHAHRSRQPALAHVVNNRAEEAYRIVRGMVPSAVPRQSLGTTRGTLPMPVVAEASKRTTRGPRTRLPTTTRARSKAPPVTPKKRRGVVNTEPPEKARPEKTTSDVQGNLEFHDFTTFVSLIRTVSHLTGLVGHVLVRVQLLNVARRLSERHVGVASPMYVSLSVDTAHEYIKLGRAEKAVSILAHLLPSIRNRTLPQELVITFLIRYCEALAVSGEVLKASMTYCDAVATSSDLIVEEKSLPTAQRIRVRAAILERAAEAALSYAAIQDARDDPTSSIEGLLQALRLWNRAVDTISRLQPTAPKQVEDDNPFAITTESKQDTKAATYPETRVLSSRASNPHVFLDPAGWRLAEGLMTTLLALSQAYSARGSAREAEYFAQQTKELAESLNAPVMISRALAQCGELQIQMGQLQEGHRSLMDAAELVVHLKGPDAAEIRRIQGRYSQLSSDSKGAQQLFEEAASLLDELGNMFASLDTGTGLRKSLPMSPRSLGTQTVDSVLAPTLLARVLRHQISLLHEVGEEYTNLLERFAKLSHSADAKAEEIALRAKLTLDEVYSRFRADMFLSSLAESAMSIPMGMSGEIVPSPASQDMLETLATAEKLFWEHMNYIARRGQVSSVREAAICLALIRTFRTSLGRGDKYTPILAAQLLDASTATTLRREMLDVIRHKFLDMNTADDLQWPIITPNGSPLPAQPAKCRNPKYNSSGLSDSEEDDPVDDMNLKVYWDSIAKRYEAKCFDAQRMSVSQADKLPHNWTVVNVSITDDRQTLFVTRQRSGKKPLIFCLPLKGRREGQEDERLTCDDAMKEMQEIIRLSDEGTRQAADVKRDNKAAGVAWWKARKELDTRLKELLADIEFCWLGAFKTIFSPKQRLLPSDLVAFRSRLDTVFKGSLIFQDKKLKSRIDLEDGLLECFSALPPSCRDEELEDLVYFILDLYQFHGIPVAISEVDMDQVVVELRNALEEHAARLKGRETEVPEEDDEHLFLVLDKNVQGIPWESLPSLRGQSVSRIPNIDFLLDRLDFAAWRRSQEGGTQDVNAPVDEAVIDPRKTYFMLNPSNDLKGTEERFSDWLKGMKSVGWDGVIGHAPSEQQLLDALKNRDLVIYFGHGGAEQYVRSHKIRHLQRCAATMLWGCSSGTLKYMGDFDRTGTPYHYMLAGCPTLIANLWDVTDRDIDKFSQSVFDDLHLTAEPVKGWRADDVRSGKTSVVKAVAHARDSCRLKYLTGAAPVVYGIPFYL